MKFTIFKFTNVTSTNDVAINLIKDKKEEQGCVYAEKQTNGRGTQGKKWISDRGNLFGSIFFPLKKDYPPFNEFSIINPIIISDTLTPKIPLNHTSWKRFVKSFIEFIYNLRY